MEKIKKKAPVFVTIAPVFVWMLLLGVVPLLYVLVLSFSSTDGRSVIYRFTLSNYAKMADSVYQQIYINSLVIAVTTTIICVLLGYPFAYAMARSSKKKQSLMMVLLMIPFWTNSVIRLYGWRTFLGSKGLLNNALLRLGLTSRSVDFLYNRGTVILGMVYTLLPFMILPIYSSLQKLDWSLLEASYDLGAKGPRTFFKVVVPLTSSSIFSGVLMVFIPCLGYYFVEDIMGGGNSQMIGNVIETYFKAGNNWPVGAAFSVILIMITLLLVTLYKKCGGSMDDLM